MPNREIVLIRWAGIDGWKAGRPDGVTEGYEAASWESPVVRPGFPATELIPSWAANTPGDSFVRIELRGVSAEGRSTRWYNLGEWAAEDTAFTRTTVKGQSDDDAVVDADVLKAADGRAWEGVQARVSLLRPSGSTEIPVVNAMYVAATAVPTTSEPSRPKTAQGKVLGVPPYSQLLHKGGESLCSAASTSMVLSYWGVGPGPGDDPSYPDACVDHAARQIFDQGFDGCGNWPFNTAYAARFGVRAFVTRLRSLNEAELFIEAGIPLVVSASYGEDEVPGLDYETEGHLTVLIGFTAEGDPVLNDPNAPVNAQVRKTVGRAEWEAAWLRSSRGVVYVIHPASVSLPPSPPQPNW